jgi:hypothetical protein
MRFRSITMAIFVLTFTMLGSQSTRKETEGSQK